MTASNRRSASRWTALGGLLLAGGVLAACSSTVTPGPACNFRTYKQQLAEAEQTGPVMVPQTPGSIADIPLNAVNVTDKAISNKVLVQSTNARRLDGGQVEARARIVNCTDYALQVEGRTHFLDEGQGEVEPPTAWQRLPMPPHTIGTYSATSARTEAVDTYYIELREGS
ncbi:hypothetical protein [Rhodovibrio salinarum]|uniref:Lipoprotein n=1 Tax=Rhodovibrio salinarum TaxID=1087 RepID=A0A934QE70_9PROT|nr:hypothetical protein [Rhodovibrio salinarum]MBK1695707.1 hypothetical protein [Rhodovibrio salinarum]